MRTSIARGAAVAATAALALTACQGSTPDGAGGAEGFVVAVRNGDNNVVPLLVEEWNSLNPDSPATVELLDGNADQQRQQLSLELDAGSSEFDVVGLDVTWTGEFAENGWVTSLEGLRAEAEQVHYPGPLASGQYQGEQYALPLLVGVGLLYYRTDLIDEPASTWDELVAQGTEAAEAADISAYAGQGAAYEGMICNFLEYLWGAGGDLFSENGTRATLTEGDAAMTALTFMQEAYDSGFYTSGFNTMTEAEARPAFESGSVAMMRHWVAPYLPMSTSEDSKVVGSFDVAPLPTFDGSGTAATLGGLNLAVNAHSENQDAAAQFIAWASSDLAAQSILAEHGIGPASSEVYDSDVIADNRFLTILAEILPDARPRPPLPNWGDISAVMSRELFEAYTGQKDAQAALDAIQVVLEESVAE